MGLVESRLFGDFFRLLASELALMIFRRTMRSLSAFSAWLFEGSNPDLVMNVNQNFISVLYIFDRFSYLALLIFVQSFLVSSLFRHVFLEWVFCRWTLLRFCRFSEVLIGSVSPSFSSGLKATRHEEHWKPNSVIVSCKLLRKQSFQYASLDLIMAPF